MYQEGIAKSMAWVTAILNLSTAVSLYKEKTSHKQTMQYILKYVLKCCLQHQIGTVVSDEWKL
jgi:thiamine monophosphate synthase